jgi:septal ring factor EnvC (AmiA/AmiB activator)
MKKSLFALLASALLCASLAVPALSQAPPQTAPKKVPTIFDYKQEVGLSSDQETRMKTLLKDLQTSMASGENRLRQMESEYRKLLAKDPSIEQARAKLQEIAATTVDLRLVDLQTSRRISAVLSAEQLKKWREIQVRLQAGKNR